LARDSKQRTTRLRKVVVFQRFLAGLLTVAPDRWVLKGGLALDFRLADRQGTRPRVTKDMDLARTGEIEAADENFRRAQEIELPDYFGFDVRRVALARGAPVPPYGL
jgi:hypothetical protein